ncbi:hypothetical protein GQ53DRAFT_816119 [Thozetella sp. PMI_491]|nr:hypothetical protein GQ53DRAFT_816119 [Thozetella sp. PMI_491]
MDESQPFLEQEPIGGLEKNQYFRRTTRSRRISFMDMWSSKSKLFLSHFLVFAVTSCFWGVALVSVARNSNPQAQHHPSAEMTAGNAKPLASKTYLTCGNSLQEAKSLGCKYDILTNAWLPGQCTDLASIEEYQADGSWFPYADENRTQALTVDRLGDMEFYYTSMRDHIVHCAVLWIRQFRAFTEEWAYVDSITIDPEHTTHCAKFLMEQADLESYRDMPIRVFVGQSGCYANER